MIFVNFSRKAEILKMKVYGSGNYSHPHSLKSSGSGLQLRSIEKKLPELDRE
jgi:hypothetical protein